jgi:Matrixin
MSGDAMRTSLVGLATAVLLGFLLVVRAGGISALATSGGDDSYTFLQHQSQSRAPVTYSSCKPIRVEINLDGAQDQAEAKQVILEAMGEISAASHLNLVFTGVTRRRPHYPDSTLTVEGGVWPVLVAFATPTEVPDLAGNVDGVGGSAWIEQNGRRTYVSGQVALDKAQVNSMLAGYDGHDRVKGVVMHELGHVLGLGHVADPRQVMYKSGNSSNELGAGDRRGLALLGQGPCV